MTRKPAMVTTEARPKRSRGRPRTFAVAPTKFGRWMDDRHLSAGLVLALLKRTAVDVKLKAPSLRAIYDLRNGLRKPSLELARVIDEMTNHEIGFDDWR